MTSAFAPSAPPTAVVLCGGASRRFGADKTKALLGGAALLDRVVGGLPADWRVVCVGSERPLARSVDWCREEPPGGGPVAALAAALPLVSADVVVVLGGDMPYAGEPAPGLVARLRAEPDLDGVVGRDGEGRLQPLLAAYRTQALREAVPDPPGGPLMALLDRMRTVVVPLVEPAALDVDTPEDLDRAGREARRDQP